MELLDQRQQRRQHCLIFRLLPLRKKHSKLASLVLGWIHKKGGQDITRSQFGQGVGYGVFWRSGKEKVRMWSLMVDLRLQSRYEVWKLAQFIGTIDSVKFRTQSSCVSWRAVDHDNDSQQPEIVIRFWCPTPNIEVCDFRIGTWGVHNSQCACSVADSRQHSAVSTGKVKFWQCQHRNRLPTQRFRQLCWRHFSCVSSPMMLITFVGNHVNDKFRQCGNTALLSRETLRLGSDCRYHEKEV